MKDIYDTAFSGAGVDYDAFVLLWGAVGEILRIDPGVLLPSDRFGVELAPPAGHELSDELEEVGELLEGLAKDKGVVLDPETVSTLRDAVTLLCAVQSSAGTGGAEEGGAGSPS